MIAPLYNSMSAAKQYAQSLQVTTNNIANANTTGFKGDQVSFKSLHLNSEGVSSVAYPELVSNGIDFTQGALNHTNNGADLVAAGGNSFFSMRAPDGENHYLRSVSYHVDAQGILVNYDGSAFLSTGGGLIVVGDAQIEINSKGQVISSDGQGYKVLGTLRTSNLSNENALKSGTGRIVGSEENPPPVNAESRVISGYKEASNVNSVSEMSRLISIQRDYELTTKMIETSKTLSDSSTKMIAN